MSTLYDTVMMMMMMMMVLVVAVFSLAKINGKSLVLDNMLLSGYEGRFWICRFADNLGTQRHKKPVE